MKRIQEKYSYSIKTKLKYIKSMKTLNKCRDSSKIKLKWQQFEDSLYPFNKNKQSRVSDNVA